MNNSTSTAEPATAVITLADCSAAAEAALRANEPFQAAALTQIILRRLPRHLLSYGRLVRAAWHLRRWDEGEDWGRRLLRADPGNGAAWRALARAAEARNGRAAAHAAWQRAFESDPYEPEIRSGLSRTTVGMGGAAGPGVPDALALNPACLARLYLRGYRWERAERVYRQLIAADPRRIDFQVGLLGALWQRRAKREAYDLARQLTQYHPHLLIAWTVLDDLGDVNDQALAQHPIAMMDPEGEFVRYWFGLPFERSPMPLTLSPPEASLVRGWENR